MPNLAITSLTPAAHDAWLMTLVVHNLADITTETRICAMITLTPENAKSIAKLAALIGWTPDQLADKLTATLQVQVAIERNSK